MEDSLVSTDMMKGGRVPRCAPGVPYSDGTCFSLEQLVKIAYAYNQRWIHESAAGKQLAFTKINIIHDKPYLLDQLRTRLQRVCGDDQACWVKQDFIKVLRDVDISKYTFRPHGPQGRFEWLSTTHIEDVISQYQRQHNDFLFLGAVPMDFDDLPVLGIRNINFNQLESKGVRRLAIVFNTDEHWKPGQHWIAAFADLEKFQIYFFDSTGHKPEKRVIQLFARIAKHCIQSQKCDTFDIRYNPYTHQRGDSECGVYALNFIIRLLKGETFDSVIYRKMTDREINKCRLTYFYNPQFGGGVGGGKSKHKG